MILEVKQFQGAQVLYVTVGINGRKQKRRSLEIKWSRNWETQVLAITMDFEVAQDELSTKDLNDEKGEVWYNHRVWASKEQEILQVGGEVVMV